MLAALMLHENFRIITTLILERPLCMTCIAGKSDLTEEAVGTVLARILLVMKVHMNPAGRCRACGAYGVTIHCDQLAD
jgi:hypothetical protein